VATAATAARRGAARRGAAQSASPASYQPPPSSFSPDPIETGLTIARGVGYEQPAARGSGPPHA